jgi:predicted nuclease with TOPRIM domain
VSDEAPAPAQDTPDPLAPDTGTPSIDYEQRYNDLRPKFDQTAQEAAQLRQWRQQLESDPSAQREFLQSLGYEVEEPAPGLADPNEDLRQKLAELESWKESLTAEQAQAQQLKVLEQSVDEQFTAIPDLNPSDREWVEDRALTRIPPREDGMPDIQAAYQQLVERDNRLLSERAKRRKSAPAFAQGGKEGTQAPDMGDDDTRRAYMAARFSEMDTA